ncbi:hypothetical protein F2P56_017886 [Juglans regia]|uniref:Uncharacterized protein n=1 Tax=Juglans regia TaxID=51240 RepID=A0A833V0I2_JUGRE|nr:hypothetical protein F2P56_017886 [Juglans regia]
MPSVTSPQLHEKASGFFSSSGVKFKEARQSAGTFVGEVSKDAKDNLTDVAERVGLVVKSRWALLQKPSTRQAVQERLICAAASTGTLLRKGVTETKGKVVVGKTKVEEVAKKTAQRSKTLLTDIERWQKGVASTDGKLLKTYYIFAELSFYILLAELDLTVSRKMYCIGDVHYVRLIKLR